MQEPMPDGHAFDLHKLAAQQQGEMDDIAKSGY
jgi:hypothetical protein